MSKSNSNLSSGLGMKVLSDSGWKLNAGTSIPGRGIRDYDRTIKFDHTLSQEELKQVKKWLQENNCPGWTTIQAHAVGDNTYGFSTTFDSSD